MAAHLYLFLHPIRRLIPLMQLLRSHGITRDVDEMTHDLMGYEADDLLSIFDTLKEEDIW